MQIRKWWVLRLAPLLIALVLTPMTVRAQGVTIEELDDWFYSRLAWGAIIGALLGVLASLVHLCRLKFKVRPSNVDLSVDMRARRGFVVWLATLFFVGAIVLFIDAWLVYEFGLLTLDFWEALGRVWLNYRTLLILAAALAGFTLMVLIVTRLKSDCRCRFAFIPGPRGK